MSETTVKTMGLTKLFHDEGRGEVRAVDGLDFEVQAGTVFGLLGANGAGKTTTLRMLSTVLRPSAGTATVMGHDVLRSPREVRRCLGFHSASTALYPRLTARETLEFFASVGGVPRSGLAERVDELIQKLGISAFAETRIDRLSSGMRQKVAIARTLAHDPPVLIFDEPTVGLDVLVALEMLDVIRALRDQGKTVVLSTHVMSEAEKLCDRIAIIHGGRLLACDSLEGLRAATGQRYLEEIFVQLVTGGDASR